MKKIIFFLFFFLVSKSFAHICICTEFASSPSISKYLAIQRKELQIANKELSNTEKLYKTLLKEKEALLKQYKAIYAMELDNALKLKEILHYLKNKNALLYLKLREYNDLGEENFVLEKMLLEQNQK